MVEQGKFSGVMQPAPAPAPAPAPSSAAANLHYNPYPPPLAKYEDIAVNPKLFLDTLQKLHTSMGTKFMIPIIGGRDLDLHKLFVEVTTRGGVEKILREKKWKEVTAVFNFPSTATNASFILRKHYFSLLHHYEQIYFFKAQGWTPMPHGSWQSGYALPITVHGAVGSVPSLSQAPAIQPQGIRLAEPVPQGSVGAPPSSVGSQVTGVIDGKFEGGYLVTVTVGTHKLKGVLYHTVPTTSLTHQVPQPQGTVTHPSQSNTIATSVLATPVVRRRRRRKKSEIKRRDPAHPKPNRSGYNFFFAEQHGKLKPLYVGRDREISRIIGELWTNLKEEDKTVYQEQAVSDKERYRREMEGYRERLRTGQVISDAVPIQQRPPIVDAKMEDAEVKEVVAGKDYSETFEDEEDEDDEECSMSGSEYEDDAEDPLEDLNVETSHGAEPMTEVTEPMTEVTEPVHMEEAAPLPPPLTLSMSNQTVGEVAGGSREELVASVAVSEDQEVKTSIA